jgi:2-phospho-L-lactate guanylyltransferase
MRLALIPVKELSHAKARLAPALDSAARRELAGALFRDVLAAALGCSELDGVIAVTRDAGLLSIARASGAEGLPEAGSLNEALTSAADHAARRSAARLVVLAADLPLATDGEIAAVISADADVALVPSGDGGTNALALAPGAIRFLFGPQSAQRHLDAARAAGLRGALLHLPGLALDIDMPADIERLCAVIDAGEAVGEYTLAELERSGLVTPPVRGG